MASSNVQNNNLSFTPLTPPPLRLLVATKPVSTLPASSFSKEVETKVTLRQCFSTVVDRKPLCITMSELRQILNVDLNINTVTLPVGMENVLAEALAYYIRLWPGWSRSTQYFTGQLQFKKWFEKFRQYLIYKMNYIVKKGNSIHTSQTVDDDVEVVTPPKEIKTESREVQTDPDMLKRSPSANKPDAPYQLVIGGPPHILNSLVFVKQGNDVLIKQHSDRPWTDLTLKQLMNWPYVRVEVKLTDVSLWRSNVLEYKRYIGLCGDIKQVPAINTAVVVKETEKTQHEVFSFNYVTTYLKQMLEVVKACPRVTADRVELLDYIFHSYMEDLEEADVYGKTVCTFAEVSYHIGKYFYFRNKRIMTSGGNPSEVVNFYEFLVPKAVYGTGYFKAAQDQLSSEPTFQTLNRIKFLIDEKKETKELDDFVFIVNNTCVVFSCTLCKLTFSGPYAKQGLLNHFRDNHKLEQSVLCFKCQKQHDILSLTEKRWKHDCVGTQ